MAAFCNTLLTLGPKLGAVLFQLPPNFARDTRVLADFLDAIPPGLRIAFEFRHHSWHDDEVFTVMTLKNSALCVADSERLTTPAVMTADFAYFRLRDEGIIRRTTVATTRRWT